MHLLVLLAALLVLPAGRPAPQPAAAHNFHVSYGRLAVQGKTAMLQVRFFRDDLEETLRADKNARTYTMRPTADVEADFLAYFNRHFALDVGGRAVQPRVVGSGEEGEMWFYRLAFEAPAELDAFEVRNTLLFNAFDDQRNIVKVMHFPDEKIETLYFTDGAEAFKVRF